MLEQISPSTIILFIGLLFNFVVMVLGGLALFWRVTQAFGALGERIAILETTVKDLRRWRHGVMDGEHAEVSG